MGSPDRPAGDERRWAVLAVCCLSLFLVSLDATVVNVALPAIRTDLGSSISGLQWTVDGFTLVMAMLLMLSASFGDRLGRRRVYRTGLVLFVIGSLLCSLAPGLGWLVAFRVVQAIGGSMLNPVAVAIIVNTFADPRERARALGVWGSVAGFSMALGPLVGGALVSAVGWRAIFWINVPVGVLAFVLTALVVPESRAPRPRAVDPAGQVLVGLGLGGLTYAIIEAPNRGWLAPDIVGPAVLAAVAVVALVAVERRRPEPLVDPRFFRSVPFTAATVTAIAAFAVLGAFLFINTWYLQELRGYTPVRAGLLTLPMALGAGGLAFVSGRLVAARGPRLALVVSGVSTVSGALMLLPMTPDTTIPWLLTGYALIGIGLGLVNAPITYTATSGMPRAQAGVAAAIASTGRQTGICLGVAVSGSLLAGIGFARASRVVWLLVAGCGVLVLILGIVSTSRWGRATADRTRALFEVDGPAGPRAVG